MSSTRYIEILSKHRNRTEYPLQSDFIVPISGFNNCQLTQYLDPISTSAPIYTFERNSITHSGITMNGSYKLPGLDVSVAVPVVPGGTNTIYRAFVTPGSFKGYIFTDGDISSNRLIVDSKPSVNDSVCLDIPLQAGLYASGQNYGAYDLSGAQSNDPVNSPYPGALPVYDYRKIYCSQAFDVFGSPCPSLKRLFIGYWLKKEPFMGGITISPPEYSLITDYDSDKRHLILENEIPLPVSGYPFVIYSIRQTVPSSTFRGNNSNIVNAYLIADTLVNSYTFTVLSGNASPLVNGKDPGYIGNYVYFVPQSTDPAIYVNFPVFQDANDIQRSYYYRIVDYPANDTFVLDRPINLSAFFGGILNLRPVEILPVTHDNFVPLEYNGTIVSQNETVCYEIGLKTLTLPNVPLSAGSQVSFYPYVYVLLENQTSPGGGVKDVIYSNNPPAHKALFVAPITDVNNPLTTPFVRINASGMVQTIKFKPNDYLHFKVFLPDGSPFQTIQPDNISPVPPNDLLQISAVFSIKRL